MRRSATALIAMPLLMLAVLVPALPANAGAGCYEKQKDREPYVGGRVRLENNCFDPAVVRVEPDTKITWVNAEPIPHTVTGVGYRWGVTMGDLLEGDTYSQRFEEEGTFLYFCAFHPGMVGAVVVGDGVGDGSAPSAEKEMEAPVTTSDSRPASIESSGAASKGDAVVEGILLVVTIGVALLVGGYLLLNPRKRTSQT